MNNNIKLPAAKHKPTSAVEVIWQWLTYTGWLWAIGIISFLVAITLKHFLVGGVSSGFEASEGTVYMVVATAILVPVAFFLDKTYRSIEPQEKHGFTAVILALYAVAAFLAILGSIIGALVILITMLTEVNPNIKEMWVPVISLLVAAILVTLFFIRVTKTTKFAWVSKYFSLIIAAFAAVVLVFAAVGPIRSSISHRTDRFIESNLPSVSMQVSNYIQQNKKLPASLSDLTFNEYEKQAKGLVGKNLVELKDKGATTEQSSSKAHNYELCVTYRYQKGDGKIPNNVYYPEKSAYVVDNSYIDTISHPSGYTCYPQTVVIYQDSWDYPAPMTKPY